MQTRFSVMTVSGHELLLTCKECNNTAGTKLDADAKTKEDVRLAMTGRPTRPHRIKATIGGITVNGQLHAKDGSYSLTIPKHLNRPGTSEELQRLGRAGTSLTVEHERYSELGARISWLRGLSRFGGDGGLQDCSRPRDGHCANTNPGVR